MSHRQHNHDPHHSPSLRDFEKIAWRAFERLPKEFRDTCGDIALRIVDFPDPETLKELDISSPFGLLGLYRGIDMAHQSNFIVSESPEMIFLYRRPILAYQKQEGDGLDAVITHVLIHEIGHHFGLTDADMEAIENGTADSD